MQNEARKRPLLQQPNLAMKGQPKDHLDLPPPADSVQFLQEKWARKAQLS